MQDARRGWPIADAPDVSETYVDCMISSSFVHHIVRLEFGVLRQDMKKQSVGDKITGVRRVASRLVMPLSLMIQLHSGLSNMLKQFERDGIIQRSPQDPATFVVPETSGKPN